MKPYGIRRFDEVIQDKTERILFYHGAIGFHVASPSIESHAACILWFQRPMIDLALPLGQKVKC
jgi:hypothetical protein